MTHWERRLRKVNKIFAEDTFPFGLSETGLPRVKWMYSEDDRHPMRMRHPDGNLRFDIRCHCGLNKRPKHLNPEEHSENCSGAVVAEPVYEMRRVLDFHGYVNRDGTPIRRQVVLWKWMKGPDEKTWEAAFGSQLAYEPYRKGMYEPVSAGITKLKGTNDLVPITICIENEDELPTVETTLMLMQKFRELYAKPNIIKSPDPVGFEFKGKDLVPIGKTAEAVNEMYEKMAENAKQDPKRTYSFPTFAPLVR